MRRDEFTDKEILEAYSSSVSVPEAADKLGVNRKTLWKWLKNLGVETKRSVYQDHEKRDWGEVAKWLRKNNDKPLPRSPRELAKMSGLSVAAWNNYIYRRRIVYRGKIKKYLTKYLAENDMYPNGHSKEQDYTLNVDLFTHSTIVTLEDGSTFKIATKAPSGYRRKDVQ